MNRPGVFVDRDGTINARPPEHEYVRRLEDFHLLPHAVDALERLGKARFRLFVVSNQRGIARGLVDHDVLAATERHLQERLAERGVAIAAFRYCPHDVSDYCTCRKPKPGLILSLADEFCVPLRASFMVGDSWSDVLAGRAAGCETVLLTTRPEAAKGTLTAPSLIVAATMILDGKRAEPAPSRHPASLTGHPGADSDPGLPQADTPSVA